uniref:Serine-type D-Ala-D-Ala carboxypeptidase n=1 Tax=Schlesneria paludicola TaxID=360056 RepID=A0A7C4LJM2_9PLAN
MSNPRAFVGCSVIVVLVLWLCPVGVAASSEWETVALADAIAPRIKAHEGQVAVVVKHLARDVEFAYRADEPMPTASLIKLPVMIAAYEQAAQGRLDWQQRVVFAEEDRVPGSGILGPHFTPGLQLTLRDAVRLMIVYSDNIATNLVLKELGLATTNEVLERLGCPRTRIHAFVYRANTSLDPAGSAQFGLGRTTAREMTTLLARLQRGEIVNAEACRAMLDHLAACDDRSRLARLLPAGTKVALKTGAVNAVRTVAGIVEGPSGPFVVCVLTAENKDRRWSDENAAHLLSAQIAQAAYQVFNPQPSPAAPSDGVLKAGSQGELVTDLQRTLNRRLNPSPGLSLDGEFGPVTERAVKQLQREAGLPETGVVDSATWAALGPLVPADDNPPPQARAPSDAGIDRPIVTCKAWLAGDPATGEIVGGEQIEQPRDFASTTKIMTAFVVLRYLEQHPEEWDQSLFVSQAADETPGSTAAVRFGERVRVRDMLYGLMLPSGNDAAVALAEHFGPKFVRVPDVGDLSPVLVFVREMNRTAEELGLTATQYVNPHGLTHQDHKASPRDLFRLAVAAWRHPEFRGLVQTRYHRAEAVGPGGYRRVLVWRNTNQLLAIEGYAGIKTGTTDAAGACLVALEQRSGREALVVVLGSTSPDARYIDSRNIFRWYWSRQGLP